LNLIKESTVEKLNREEAEKVFGDFIVLVAGGNCRSRAEKARQLGWRPKENQVSLFDSVEAEIKSLNPS